MVDTEGQFLKMVGFVFSILGYQLGLPKRVTCHAGHNLYLSCIGPCLDWLARKYKGVGQSSFPLTPMLTFLDHSQYVVSWLLGWSVCSYGKEWSTRGWNCCAICPWYCKVLSLLLAIRGPKVQLWHNCKHNLFWVCGRRIVFPHVIPAVVSYVYNCETFDVVCIISSNNYCCVLQRNELFASA